MAEITIDTKYLEDLLKKASNNKPKKKKKGSIEYYNNGKARLSYMLNKELYRTTVEVTDEKDAEIKLDSFIEQVEKGLFINTNYTFAEWAQIWLDEKVRPNSGEISVKKYIGTLNNRILPYIGNIKLKDLSKKKLEKYFNTVKYSKTNYKNRKENKTVKPATVRKWKTIIHACLEYAVDNEILPKNPCDKIYIRHTNTTDENTIKELVKNKRNKINYYTKAEFKTVCSKIENEFMEYYYNNNISNDKKLREVGRRFILLLALKTGMRRSEIFGLTREDLNLKKATFDVNKSRHYLSGKGKYTTYPKTDSSIREKSLPKSILSYLKLYYELLDDLHYENDYIFDYLSIDGLCSWFNKWQQLNNIKKIRFHDLRHTHATILLDMGVDVKTISERLGHSEIDITLNLYAAVLKELDERSINKIDSL